MTRKELKCVGRSCILLFLRVRNNHSWKLGFTVRKSKRSIVAAEANFDRCNTNHLGKLLFDYWRYIIVQWCSIAPGDLPGSLPHILSRRDRVFFFLVAVLFLQRDTIISLPSFSWVLNIVRYFSLKLLKSNFINAMLLYHILNNSFYIMSAVLECFTNFLGRNSKYLGYVLKTFTYESHHDHHYFFTFISPHNFSDDILKSKWIWCNIFVNETNNTSIITVP